MHDCAVGSRFKQLCFAMKIKHFMQCFSGNRGEMFPRLTGAIFMLLMILAVSSAAQAVEKKNALKNVLLLNSYHQGFKWTDDVTRGIVSALSPVSAQTRLYIENMNTKWANDEQYFALLLRLMKIKYAKTRFELIVCSDTDAFLFLRDHRDELFGKVPVVFCGVNYFRPQDLQGKQLFTGVSETADMRETLDLALRLHPGTKEVLIINDSGNAGSRMRAELERQLPLYRGKVRFKFENSSNLDVICRDVAGLPADSLVFYTFFYGSPSLQFYENTESISRISRNARVPVYGPYGFNLGYGIVGGKLTSAFDHGKAAGEMALSILRGKPVEKMPVRYENPSRYMFDHRQLTRFHIPKRLLPEGSEIVNEPEAFHRVRKEVVWATLGGIAVLGCVVFLLLFVIRTRRKAESLLRVANEELEARVGERTHELTVLNQHLTCLNDQLAAVNEELNDDIMMRRQTEEQLRTSQKILSKIFEANPDHLVVMDRNLKAVQTNRQSDSEMSTDMRSRNPYCFEGLGSESGSPCEPCAARDVFRSGKPVFVEKYDARIGYLEIRAVPIFDENGDVTLVAEHIRDITERKKMEEDIVKAQKLESLGVLAGGIAHDFNNLLTAILGNISLAKILLDPLSKAHVRLVEAEKGCDRAAGLTQKLITFAKGGAPIRKAASIGSVLVVAASDMLRGSAVKCEFSLPDGLWAVEIDKGQMSQVVNNLFKNAAQAMPDGGLISVQAENFVAGPEENLPLRQGRYLRISIRDHGPGIAEEDLPRIFDPYFTTRQDGSGLGLATAYSIINKHNGYLEVETTIGAGTVFHIYLPVSVQELDNEPDQQCCLNPGNSPQAC
ncbi:MAG: ABC transporter substrate binding protein [Geobacteraceae bacterium]|nr:ABC transporter substrate binding protein [Geobacteraceae bacterium]